MKKIINVPENYTDDMLKGIYLANKQVKYVANDLRCYCIADKKPGKVAIVTGGGTGHLPLCLTAVVWEVFFSRPRQSRFMKYQRKWRQAAVYYSFMEIIQAI